MGFYESIQVHANICNGTVSVDLSVKRDVDIFLKMQLTLRTASLTISI